MPHIVEEYPSSSSHSPSLITNDDKLLSTLHELDLDSSYVTSSTLSPTQIDAIIKAVIAHLQKHGKITTELLTFIRDGFFSPCNSTFTTPPDCPILLSSDKMPNTAPSHYRFTT